jgi:hypothetical protein
LPDLNVNSKSGELVLGSKAQSGSTLIEGQSTGNNACELHPSTLAFLLQKSGLGNSMRAINASIGHA